MADGLMPAILNSVYSFTATFQNKQTEVAIDLTTFALGVRFYRQDCERYEVALTEGSGIDVTNAADGEITVSLTPSQVNCVGTGSISVIIYKNYSNDTTRAVIATGSEVFRSQHFDSGGRDQTLFLHPHDSTTRITIS